MTYVLGIDLGTGSLKGLLMNELGKIIASESSDYPLLTPKAGYSEQNPAEWVNALNKVILTLGEKVTDLKNNLVGISFSGQMHSLVMVDKNGDVIRPAILWNDVRTTSQCKEIMARAGEIVLSKTKNIALEGFTLPKLIWVQEHEPENFSKLATFMLPKDYLGYYLTGSKHIDYSDAAGTLLLNVEKKQWSESIAKIFNIPKTVFPELITSNAQIGTIQKNIAERLGLSEDVKVFAGGADNACAALGAGIVSEDVGMASIGTSGVFLAFEGSKVRNYDGKLHFFNHVVPNNYYSMGVTLSAGQSLNWLKSILDRNSSFEDFLKDINTIPVGSDGLLFAPFIMGERTPYIDSQIRGSFLGIDARHTSAHFKRAVLEGITYSLKESQTIMMNAGKKFSLIVSVGGGAKNPDWLQMQADIFNTEVVTLQVEQGPGLGAAMLAAIGCGIFPDVNSAVAKCVAYSKKYQPIKKNVQRYAEHFAIYQKIYSATKEISHELLAISTD